MENVKTMKKDNPTLISAEELEALVSGWGASSSRDVDVYYPLRIWFLILLCLTFATGLLFNSPYLSIFLVSEPELADRLVPFLYFRGWFVLGMLGIGLYAYLKNWYTTQVFSIFTVVGCVNLVSDLFIIYPERLAQPTTAFVVLLMARLLALGILFLNAKNARRMPDLADRLNLFLPVQDAHTQGHFR